MPLPFFKKLFASTEINTLAESLVNELTRRYPPSMASGEGRRLSPQAVTNILESVINKGVSKSREWNLGLFGKARLGNAFRWALTDKGYPEKFVETATEALVIYVTRQGDRKSAASGKA